MKVWVVGTSDCESNNIIGICATKEIAERILFEARDDLVKDWQELNKHSSMYGEMITALSGKDYNKWDNFPHECPYLYETEIVEK